jgi:hypothetical protein
MGRTSAAVVGLAMTALAVSERVAAPQLHVLRARCHNLAPSGVYESALCPQAASNSSSAQFRYRSGNLDNV